MLVLSRKKEQSVVIVPNTTEAIEIKITEVAGGRVRLGITAPRWIPIYRKELLLEGNAGRVYLSMPESEPVVAN